MGQSGGPAVDPNPPDLRYGRQPLLAGSDCGADAGVARYVTLVALRQRGGRTTRRQVFSSDCASSVYWNWTFCCSVRPVASRENRWHGRRPAAKWVGNSPRPHSAPPMITSILCRVPKVRQNTVAGQRRRPIGNESVKEGELVVRSNSRYLPASPSTPPLDKQT